jgi:uncharacterized membrane protein (UPF0127 family)
MQSSRLNIASIIGRLRLRSAEEAEVTLRVINLTRATQLAHSAQLAGNGPNRRKGLLGRDSLADGEGLWIVPCEAVHTFWMRFPIDLVYLDRRHRVVKALSNVRPWRLSGCLRAHSVVELPAGTVLHTGTKPGDALTLGRGD